MNDITAIHITMRVSHNMMNDLTAIYITMSSSEAVCANVNRSEAVLGEQE